METKNNNKYLDNIDPSKIVVYDRWVDDRKGNLKEHIKIVMLGDNNRCHKYRGFNKFTLESYELPSEDNGWYITNDECYSTERFISTICDPNNKLFDPSNIVKKPENCKLYKTIYNGPVKFHVYVSNDINYVYIYAPTNNVIDIDDWDLINTPAVFTELVKTYEYLEIFIGKSVCNNLTREIETYGDKYDGNSILLRIGNVDEFKYVYIGDKIFEFTVDEKITKYVSNIRNNCIPCPYAESLNYCYEMTWKIKTKITDHPNREEEGSIDNMPENIECNALNLVDIFHNEDGVTIESSTIKETGRSEFCGNYYYSFINDNNNNDSDESDDD